MKKITILVAALLSSATLFAQSNNASVNANTHTSAQVAANKGEQVNVSGTTSIEAGSTTEAGPVKGKADGKAALAGNASVKTKKEKKRKTETAPEAPEQTPKENHGQIVSETAHSLKATTMAEGEKVQQRGQAVAEVAQSNATAVEAKGRQLAYDGADAAVEVSQQTEARVKAEGRKAERAGKANVEATQHTQASLQADAAEAVDNSLQLAAQTSQKGKAKADAQVEQVETHGKAVVETAQGTQAAGREKGQEVKEVATARSKEKPVEVGAKTDAAAKVKVTGGASRAAGVTRASGAARTKVGAGAGAATTTVGGAVNNATKVVTPGKSNRPVQVGGAVNVGAGTKIKVGN